MIKRNISIENDKTMMTKDIDH